MRQIPETLSTLPFVGALPNGITDQLHQIGIALISQTISNNIELYKLV